MPEKGSLPGPSGVQSRVRSRTARAELSFSVSHVEHVLREDGYSKRLGATTPIFLAAVIQFLTAKVLEQAGIEAQKSGRRRVTPDLLARAVHNHPQLNDLFRSLANSQVDPD
uniref:Histone H2A n=2 Tax=Suricata suricatta TaxID=37032 RepID=A0A673UHN1_SURSU